MIPVTTSGRDTCPDSCRLKGKCYAEFGNLRLHWDTLSDGQRGMPWNEFLGQVEKLAQGQLWRYAQAGDLPGKGDRIDTRQLKQLVASNMLYDKRGYAYTHKPVIDNKANREAIAYANHHGFTINLSADGLNHADELSELGIGPVVAVIPLGFSSPGVTPKGRPVLACRHQIDERVTCATCALCQKVDRPFVIGFYPHGAGKFTVNEIAQIS